MSVWNDIAAPLCIALTVAGLGISWLRWRRKGSQSGLRAVGWSLLPLAAYLVGAVPLLGRIGQAVVQFAEGFAFSARAWAGLALFGVAVLLFVTTGGMPMLRRGKSRGKAKKTGTGATSATGSPQLPAVAGKGRRATATPADDDLSDVEEILRRRGIT
jgi:hypothetical protein